MVGVATGLAEAGFVPFVYSIATFASMRPYEFIRNGPVLHGLPVRIVGVGGGVRLRPQRHHPLRARGLRDDAGAARARRSSPRPTAPRSSPRCAPCSELPGPVYFRLGQAVRRGARPERRSELGARSNRPKAATSRSWRCGRMRARRRRACAELLAAGGLSVAPWLVVSCSIRRRSRTSPSCWPTCRCSRRSRRTTQRRARLAGGRGRSPSGASTAACCAPALSGLQSACGLAGIHARAARPQSRPARGQGDASIAWPRVGPGGPISGRA